MASARGIGVLGASRAITFSPFTLGVTLWAGSALKRTPVLKIAVF